MPRIELNIRMVRKSYLNNPDNPKPQLRGNDEWVRVSYKEAIKLIAKELKKNKERERCKRSFCRKLRMEKQRKCSQQ